MKNYRKWLENLTLVGKVAIVYSDSGKPEVDRYKHKSAGHVEADD
jgi:hypothetical protein